MAFDKWTLLKVIEVGFVLACLICKRVTDDEASRLFLYLQKISREWSLLNNVTWDKLGAAVADAIYGGYVIIVITLLFGKIFGELPTPKRVMEMIFLGLGSLLYIILGSLVFAAIDSVPPDLVDNAAVLGTLSLITALLFLIDLGGPKAKKQMTKTPKTHENISKPVEAPTNNRQDAYIVESDLKKMERKEIAALEEHSKRVKALADHNGYTNGHTSNGTANTFKNETKGAQNGYKKMKEKESPKSFGIYGKDAVDRDVIDSDADDLYKVEEFSPVWSQIRKGHYGKYDVVVPSYVYLPTEYPIAPHVDKKPSTPGDPGYVQYTAQNWGQPSQKTPRHSPTQV